MQSVQGATNTSLEMLVIHYKHYNDIIVNFNFQCGRAYYTGVCNVCRLPIGGERHVPLSGNRQLTDT